MPYCHMKDNEHTYTWLKRHFSLNQPLCRFNLYVTMSVDVLICLSVCPLSWDPDLHGLLSKSVSLNPFSEGLDNFLRFEFFSHIERLSVSCMLDFFFNWLVVALVWVSVGGQEQLLKKIEPKICVFYSYNMALSILQLFVFSLKDCPFHNLKSLISKRVISDRSSGVFHNDPVELHLSYVASNSVYSPFEQDHGPLHQFLPPIWTNLLSFRNHFFVSAIFSSEIRARILLCTALLTQFSDIALGTVSWY